MNKDEIVKGVYVTTVGLGGSGIANWYESADMVLTLIGKGFGILVALATIIYYVVRTVKLIKRKNV